MQKKEPIGPGSETMKAKMPQGGVGAVSGVKEYELTLTLAKKLEKELKARGYHTVMIRTGHDVNLSNSQRSAMANDSEAEIFHPAPCQFHGKLQRIRCSGDVHDGPEPL